MRKLNRAFGVFDQGLVAEGQSANEGVRNVVALAELAERLGYRRFWLSEHHLDPGLASSATPVLLALLAARTSRIRLGAATAQLGHRTPLAIVEEFATIDSVYPGRLDLGLGKPRNRNLNAKGAAEDFRRKGGFASPAVMDSWVETEQLLTHGRSFHNVDFREQVLEAQALFADSYLSPSGRRLSATPSRCEGLELWLMGATAGATARVAGELGLPFAASFHHSAATAPDAVACYREHFRPGVIDRPYVALTFSVLAAESRSRAEDLAVGYSYWLRGTALGAGTPRYPSRLTALANPVFGVDAQPIEASRAAQVVGSADDVVEGTGEIADSLDADEVLFFCAAHEFEDRARSFELIAEKVNALVV